MEGTVKPAVSATRYEHIVLDQSQVPFIADTTTKVVELVVEHLAYNWSAEQLHIQHPYLSLGQIHSALAYYYDHKSSIDQDIEQRRQRIKQLKDVSASSSIIEKLKARGTP